MLKSLMMHQAAPLAAAASFGDKEAQSVPKLEQANTVGKMIAEKAKACWN